MHPRPIIIGTRGSALALAQANEVKELLRRAFPKLSFEIRPIKTTGDKLQAAARTGGKPSSGPKGSQAVSAQKGLFTKEIELALLRFHADIAVHSLKDLPVTLPAGLTLAATPQRADPRDVLIYRSTNVPAPAKEKRLAPGESLLERLAKAQPTPTDDSQWRKFPAGMKLTDLPAGAVLATGSLRRRAQVLALRPDLQFEEVRGNVETRLKKFEQNPAWDAMILAAAGLERLRLQFQNRPVRGATDTARWERLSAEPIDLALMLPAVGQAAIGLEIRSDDERMRELLASINHFGTFAAVRAERALLRGLGGGCATPIAAFAQYNAPVKTLWLRAVVLSPDGKKQVRGEIKGTADNPEELGAALARELLAKGAGEI